MATLREYFEADFSHTVRMSSALRLSIQGIGELTLDSRIHLDFSSKALFASFLAENTELTTNQLIEIIDQLDNLWAVTAPGSGLHSLQFLIWRKE